MVDHCACANRMNASASKKEKQRLEDSSSTSPIPLEQAECLKLAGLKLQCLLDCTLERVEAKVLHGSVQMPITLDNQIMLQMMVNQ